MAKDPNTWVDWENGANLQKVISSSKSRVEALKKLGYHPGSNSRQKLNRAILKFNLDISSFTRRTERWEILPSIIYKCFSISDVLKAVGLTDIGDNYKTANRLIKEMGLNTDHFQQKKLMPGNKRKKEEIFVKNSEVHRHVVKARILQENLIPYKCSRCDNPGVWMGKRLVLELEHKNGINNDNRLENLIFLCPNCHSQTPTHRGKKRVTGCS